MTESNCAPTSQGPRSYQPLSPSEVAERYGFPTNQGAGEVVGIFAWSESSGGIGVDVASVEEDLRQNWGARRLPEYLVSVFPGKANDLLSSSGELTMDAKVMGYYLQQAERVHIYLARWSNADQAIAQAAADGCTVTTCSFGIQDPASVAAVDKVIAEVNESHAMTMCFASGDRGAACGWSRGSQSYPIDQIGYPSGNPHVISVGGTFIPKDCSGEEIGWWNFPPEGSTSGRTWFGSGGGVSSRFPVPTYQKSLDPLSFPDSNGDRHHGRGAPDVACLAQGNALGSGTSISSPTFASLIACLNAELKATGYRAPIPAARLQAAIYDPPEGLKPFSSVSIASNVPPAKAGLPQVGYTAESGWDACTGLGTPVGSQLLQLMQEVLGKADS